MKIDWVLSGDRSKASSRLQGYVIHDWLIAQGHSSRILPFLSSQITSAKTRSFWRAALMIARSDAEVMVFEAPEWPAFQLARLASKLGKRVIAVRCDLLGGHLDSFFDVTIVPTAGLAESLGASRFVAIEDSVEVSPELFKKSYASKGKPKLVWFGHQGYEAFIVPWAEKLHEDLEGTVDIELISAGAFATRQWSEATIVGDLLDADIVVLPIPTGEWYANKSSNRLAMLFSLGVPAIASPITSYQKLGEDGVNVLFAGTDDFAPAVRKLLDPLERERVGTAARIGLGRRFSIDTIAPRWLQVFQSTPRVEQRSAKAAVFATLLKLIK